MVMGDWLFSMDLRRKHNKYTSKKHMVSHEHIRKFCDFLILSGHFPLKLPVNLLRLTIVKNAL
jgi:hypothetical protein